ncbi:MAG: hypothetical protein NT004_01400 [Bacteroidetes bacterium]|nr:hypothetical protein [Bacteroidota bacterium]
MKESDKANDICEGYYLTSPYDKAHSASLSGTESCSSRRLKMRINESFRRWWISQKPSQNSPKV